MTLARRNLFITIGVIVVLLVVGAVAAGFYIRDVPKFPGLGFRGISLSKGCYSFLTDDGCYTTYHYAYHGVERDAAYDILHRLNSSTTPTDVNAAVSCNEASYDPDNYYDIYDSSVYNVTIRPAHRPSAAASDTSCLDIKDTFRIDISK